MTDRYVDSTLGVDTNAGTLAAPWKTFAKVNSPTGAVGGDKIILRGNPTEASPRDYPMGASADIFFGNARNNLTIENYPDEHVRLSSLGRGNSHSGFTWERWTGGGMQVRGTGSIRVGPMDPNDYVAGVAGDGNYRFGAIQLTGCQNMVFDGGPNKKLIFDGGGCDFGLYMAYYGSPGTGVGCQNITVSNFETRNDAAGVLVRGGGTNTIAPIGGAGVIIQDFIAHDHKKMLDNRGIGTDTGGSGIVIEQAGGVLVQRGVMYNNFAPSLDYGYDGCGVVPFGCPDLTIRDCEFYNCQGFIESGTNTSSPHCTNLTIVRNLFHGTPNIAGENPGSDSALLVRDGDDALIAHNTFVSGGGGVSNWNMIDIFPGTGTYPGTIKRAKFINNIFVFLDGSANSKPVMRATALPTGADAVTIDYNIYWRPNGGTIIGLSDGGTKTWAQWPAELALRGVLGAESHGKNQDPLLDALYYPAAGSPAIDAGTIVLGEVYNGAPDIGFIETATVPPPPPPPTADTGLSTYLANKLLDHQYGATIWTPPTTVYAQLHTSDPGPTGLMTAAVLSRVAVPNTTTNWPAASSRSKTNALKITFGSTAGVSTLGTVTYVSLWDASAGGNMLEWTAVTPQDINDRQEVAINPGGLTFTRLI